MRAQCLHSFIKNAQTLDGGYSVKLHQTSRLYLHATSLVSGFKNRATFFLYCKDSLGFHSIQTFQTFESSEKSMSICNVQTYVNDRKIQ